MSNELVINHELKINSNMEQLALQLKQDIEEKYNLIVTDDSVSDTKKLMAQINKDKTDFKNTFKSFKEKVFEPFKNLDEKAKEIEGYFDAARTALDNQVKKFEAGKLAKAKEVCLEYAMAECEAKGIDFEAVTISDLFNQLGSVTATGNISGKAKNEIDNRIALIENQILKARLEAEEKLKRDREIAEAAKQKAEEEARKREDELIAKMEREKQEAVEKAKKSVINENLTTPFDEPVSTIISIEEPKAEKVEVKMIPVDNNGKRIYHINFGFEIKALAGVDENKIIEKVKSMFLSEAGIQNLKNVEVK